jgi:hypothetical protein
MLTCLEPTVVPFRQCKLTELLFSNSFPSSHHPNIHAQYHHRNPQKAVMIVTADPVGDFNATSQILRYSALAREVTVPRIPSVTSTIFSGNLPTAPPPRGGAAAAAGRASPDGHAVELEVAALELVRLGDEIEVLRCRLAEEQARRREAEENWQNAEERAEAIEQEVREECWDEMEKRIEEDRRRWMNAWGEEARANRPEATRFR